jgi:hypothetical protein
MEVHHHAHTARKKWTHYFWEFLMLFLAVFCGFLAEYKLEQTIERHREKEFIISMFEDAATDTSNINTVIKDNLKRAVYLDSLASFCYQYQNKPGESTRMYHLVKNTLYRPDLLYPTDRTLYQLKNAAGMRLIRKKSSTNSIIEYDNSGKQVLNQQVYYENYLNDLSDAALELIDFPELWSGTYSPTGSYVNAKLISNDPHSLLKMGNLAKIFQGVIRQYVNRLNEMKAQAIQLSTVLKTDYHID